MLKTFALIVRRPDIDRDEFRRHYEEIHSPLALPHLEGLVRYVKYHLVDEIHGEAGFDVISGFWYRDAAAAAHTLHVIEAPEGEAIRQDERSFMDTEKNSFFAVEEAARHGDDGDDEGALHDFLMLRAPDADAERFLADFDAAAGTGMEHAPFALGHRVLGNRERNAFDRVVQSTHGDSDETRARCDAYVADGATVLAVRTRVHETPTPWTLSD